MYVKRKTEPNERTNEYDESRFHMKSGFFF